MIDKVMIFFKQKLLLLAEEAMDVILELTSPSNLYCFHKGSLSTLPCSFEHPL